MSRLSNNGEYKPDKDEQPVPVYRNTTIDEENEAEVEEYKSSLSDLQKQTLDRTTEHRYMAKQGVPGTPLALPKPLTESRAHWFGNAQRSTTEQAQAASVPDAPSEVPPVVKEARVKNHKIAAVENKGRFGFIFDAIASRFSKKETDK